MPSKDHQNVAGAGAPAPHNPYAVMRLGEFRWYLSGSMLSQLGIQAQSTVLGWEVYGRTRSNMALAMVGLVQVLPVVALFLPAGTAADRFNRRAVLIAALCFVALCSLLLAWNSHVDGPLWVVYAALAALGTARAFLQPAKSSFLPQIVPRGVFASAVTWNSGVFQFTTLAGPALGGLVTARSGSAAVVYAANAALALLNALFLLQVEPRPAASTGVPATFSSLAAGLRFVWQTKVILGAITLDMFAVLLGGATAMLPVYAEEVLHAGVDGLGWMRAAPGLGAVCMSVALAHRPPLARAGRALLWSVTGFGLVTIAFGLSRSFPLSWLLLVSLGALDMISVVVRHTLVQLLTPDAMRGRVSAVNGMFIGVSNELGEFESGLVAHLFSRTDDLTRGPTVSVVAGGIGTLVVVATVAWLRPEVRRYGSLSAPHRA